MTTVPQTALEGTYPYYGLKTVARTDHSQLFCQAIFSCFTPTVITLIGALVQEGINN